MMDLKKLVLLKAASGQKDGNLLKVTTENAARFNDGFDNWTEAAGVVIFSGESRGGYYATLHPGVTYVYSYDTEVTFQQRIYTVKEDRSLNELLYNKNTNTAEFSFEGEADQEFVFGFYLTDEQAAGTTIHNMRVEVKK